MMQQAQADEIVLQLPLAADAELRAVDELDRLMARHQVEQRAAGQARFALVEACLNAIEYGTPASEPTKQVNVHLTMREGELRIMVGNPGPFELRPSQPRRGHGLKILRSFMDEVRYLSDSQGTWVEMSKRVGSLS